MEFAIRNKTYALYVKQVDQKARVPDQKLKVHEKVKRILVDWLAKILLPSTERKEILRNFQQKKIEPIPQSTLRGEVHMAAFPSVNFLDVKPDLYPSFLKRHLNSPLKKAILEKKPADIPNQMPSNKLREEALNLAIYLGRVEELKIMGNLGFFKTEKQKRTCFELAVRYKQPEIVQYFIDSQFPLKQSKEKLSLLAQAFHACDLEVIKKLIDAKGEFKASSKDILAIKNQIVIGEHKEIAQLFLTHAIERAEYKKYASDVLHLACAFGFVDVLKELISQGTELKQWQKFASYILVCAIIYGHTDILELLLKNGLTIESSYTGPITEAAYKGSKRDLELLIQHGSPVDPVEVSGFTPLMTAISQDKQEAIEFLVQNGADQKKAELLKIQKMLTLRFGLAEKIQMKPNPEKIGLEGSSHGLSAQQLAESLAKFFANSTNATLPDFPGADTQAKILSGIKNLVHNLARSGKTNEEIIADYEAGEMVVLPSGWKRHATYRLLYKGFYIEINKGDLLPEEQGPGYRIYSINAPLKPDFVQTMRGIDDRQKEEVRKIRLQMHQKLNLKLITSGNYKTQKAGNCAWVGIKSIFRVMLLVDQYEKNRAAQVGTSFDWLMQAEKNSTTIYKQFAKQDRTRAVEEVLAFAKDNPYAEISPSLLLSTLARFKGEESIALELARHLKAKNINWKTKNYLGRGFIDHVRESHNHNLIPLLAKQGIMR